MTSKARAFKNLMFSSAGLYVESFFIMVMSIIIARSLGPESYGNYALIVWMCALGIKITNGGVTTALIKFVSECRVKYEENISPTIKYLRKIQLVKLAIVLIAFLIFFWLFREKLYQDVTFDIFLLLLLVIVLRAFYMFYVSLSKGFENFKATAAISSIASPLHLLLVVAAALISNTLIAFVIVYALSAIVYLFVSRKIALGWCKFEKNDVQIPEEMKSRIKKHVSIVMVNTLLLFLITKESELLFLKYYANGEDLGFFKVAHRLGFAIALLLPGIFEGIMLPLMSGSIAKAKDVAAVRFLESVKYIMIMAIPAALFCAIFAKDIIFLLYGEEFSRAVIPFMMLVSTCCICSIASVPTSYLLSVDKQSLILKVMLVGTVLKLSLDYYLVSRYGLMGAAIAFSVSFIFMFLANLVIAMKHLGVGFPWQQLLKLMLATGISVGAIIIIPQMFYPHPLVKLAVSGVLFAGLYLILTLLFRCWRGEEIKFVRAKIATANLGILRPLDALLSWAAK